MTLRKVKSYNDYLMAFKRLNLVIWLHFSIGAFACIYGMVQLVDIIYGICSDYGDDADYYTRRF